MGSNRSYGKGKFKANWTSDNHELFIDLCLEQILLGNKSETHFSKEGWRNILDSFHSIIGLEYDRIQLKNHWDSTKKQWNIWYNLISTEKLKWDPDTCEFGATDEEWYIYRKVQMCTVSI